MVLAIPILTPCQGYAPPDTVAVVVDDGNYGDTLHNTFSSISYILFSSTNSEIFTNGNIRRLDVTTDNNGKYVVYVPYNNAQGNYDYILISITYIEGTETDYSLPLKIYQPPLPPVIVNAGRVSNSEGVIEIKYNDLDKCNDSKLLKIRNICVNKYIDLANSFASFQTSNFSNE
jgi:hypothetical protein